MMAMAQKAREDVELQMQCCQEEVKAAKKYLADSEKRWEVIDIDQESVSPNKGDKNKKRKASLSPQRERNNAAASSGQRGGTAFTTDNRSNNNNVGAGGQHNTTAVCQTIVVSGAGLDEANGTYKRDEDKFGFASYVKTNPGEDEDRFAIWRYSNYWYMGRWDVGFSWGWEKYRSMNSSNSREIPPDYWMRMGGGVAPAPKVQIM